MKHLDCDVAIIGAGSAGMAARREAVSAGAKTLLIEAGPYGTTCARVGCMPSKLLIAAARAAKAVADAKTFGVAAAEPTVQLRAVMARIQKERDHFVAGVLAEVAAIPAREKLRGHARFNSPTTLAIDDHSIVAARSIVIATGAKPKTPAALAEVCGERLMTHETIFELPELPASLAVVGAGPLGLELALAFARLGVRTCIFDKGESLGGVADPEVFKVLAKSVSAEMSLHLGVDIETRRGAQGDVTISWKDPDGAAHRATYQYVLDAAGRPPNLENLDLNMSGLELDDHGVPVFDPETQQCGKSPIFIAGDANNARPVLHEASRQGELAGSNAGRFPKVEKRPQGVKMGLVYTDPDIAIIGSGFDPAQAVDWAIGKSDENGRARVDGEDAGMLRAYARKADGVLIGGEFFGPQVEHLGHLLAWAVQLEMKVKDVLKLPFYHPTAEERLRTCLRDVATQLG